MTDEVRSKKQILDDLHITLEHTGKAVLSANAEHMFISRKMYPLLLEILLDIRDELTAIRHEIPYTGE